MRRAAPRSLAAALGAETDRLAPATLLARVQAVWPGVAGPVMAEEAAPASERGGEVAFACRSATWAHELELLAPDLLSRLNAALGDAASGPLTGLRFRPGGASPPRSAGNP
jgi:predicted nucleic acid-binding Zn ribbon protein